MTPVSVIIPARDAADTIAWVLAGVAQQDYAGDWEVILVDDGSSDATADLALRSSVGVRLVREAGSGAAHARNAGAAVARGEWLAFLDADCRPTAGWLRHGHAALGSADLTQGATYPDPATPVGPFDRTLWVGRQSGLFESANLFVRRSAFVAADGFHAWPDAPPGRPLGEDVWFGWRVQRHGARISFCSEAVAHHAVFARSMLQYVAEGWRLRFFPDAAQRIPELREHFFYRRWFLSRRSAAFDLALVAGLVAACSRRTAPLAAAIPYAAVISDRVRGGGLRHGTKMTAAELLADAVAFAALAASSAARGSIVL